MQFITLSQMESFNKDVQFKNYLKRMGDTGITNIEKILEMVEEIRELKEKHNAVILSHYYMSPVLQILNSDGGIADFTGDSLGLSIEATRTYADYIIFCGVKFMAETASILNPRRKVLLPNMEAGCSLASSINATDVINLKKQYPGVPIIAYINTYAETKAECDICCTSRNAFKIAESFDSDKLIFIPDKYMGHNLAKAFKEQTNKSLLLWEGSCEVHAQFTDNITSMMDTYPDAEVLLHWEVPNNTVNDVLNRGKGMVGSTTDIIRYVGESANCQFILGSECDLGASLKGLYPDKEFITPCLVCPHMKRINLKNVLEALRSIGTANEEQYTITLDENIRERASVPIRRMMALS